MLASRFGGTPDGAFMSPRPRDVTPLAPCELW